MVRGQHRCFDKTAKGRRCKNPATEHVMGALFTCATHMRAAKRWADKAVGRRRATPAETRSMELKPCPWCGSSVSFHSDGDDCQGCHNVICSGCKAFVDLSSYADPENDCNTLDDLRTRITLKWNQRSRGEGTMTPSDRGEMHGVANG